MSEDRRYRLLGCLGEGGFGRVYRARLEGPEGFVKDVAIKLLHDVDAPHSVIARFRDEARILGLVRDRAVVGVDPPVRLDGRWALVMDYVDGVSCRTLLADGPVPPRVALEIIGEVARALDAVWKQHGPEGEPLHLLHRDLKPANLQLTPTGQVKVLDLGIARAKFSGREAHTTRRLSGTPGYIAPERLEGVEDPCGDVFSLGVVLHELITGLRPPVQSAQVTFEVDRDHGPPPDAAIELARQMRAPHPGVRPTAREVEVQCTELVRQAPGPSLREWAETRVPSEPVYLDDARAGSVLTESGRVTPVPASDPRFALIAGLGALVTGILAVVWIASSWTPPPPSASDALVQPFTDFVMDTNATASENTKLRQPQAWDTALFDATVDEFVQYTADPATWTRLDQTWAVWRDVAVTIRQAGLPQVVAGIPWVESHYTPELQSTWCAKGLWQLMPEVALRANRLHGVPIRVSKCRFEDGTEWSPSLLAPPKDKPYLKDGQCRIPKRLGCQVDDRVNVKLATQATLALLEGAWTDPDLRASGGLVQLTVASHFVGHDDSAFGQPNPQNVKPAFTEWATRHPEADHPRFLSATDSQMSKHAADLVPRALAIHFAAVCYYGQNYQDEAAFRDWAKYADGYCRSAQIPNRSEVAF